MLEPYSGDWLGWIKLTSVVHLLSLQHEVDADNIFLAVELLSQIKRKTDSRSNLFLQVGFCYKVCSQQVSALHLYPFSSLSTIRAF